MGQGGTAEVAPSPFPPPPTSPTHILFVFCLSFLFLSFSDTHVISPKIQCSALFVLCIQSLLFVQSVIFLAFLTFPVYSILLRSCLFRCSPLSSVSSLYGCSGLIHELKVATYVVRSENMLRCYGFLMDHALVRLAKKLVWQLVKEGIH